MADAPRRGLGAMFRDAPASLRSRSTSVDRRLAGLDKAVAEARGHLDDRLLDEVVAASERSAGRLGLSSEHTVIAIAGSTGSGKSTTFNALAGVGFSTAGAQRPTTSVAKALIWSDEQDDDLQELLEWLGVPPSGQFHRSRLSPPPPRGALPEGTILIDLPDHDSFESAHHEEAERVVALADVMVWVVDPQKYADAAIHERFLRPLAGHRGVTMVLLNHIDIVPEEDRPNLLRELRKVLVADGMRDPRILGISARQGIGIEDLRTALRRRVEGGNNAERRAGADIAAAVARLEAATGDAPAAVPDPWVADLERRVAAAADVSGAADRSARSARAEAAHLLAWPLKGGGPAEEERITVGPVDRPAVNAGIRAFADQLCRDLTPAWGEPIRAAITSDLQDTSEHLDAELGALRFASASLTGLGATLAARKAAVVSAIGGVLLLGAGLIGVVPVWWLGALLLGLALVLEIGFRATARRATDRAAAGQGAAVEAECLRVISKVVRGRVIAPANTQLAGLARFRAGLDAARAP